MRPAPIGSDAGTARRQTNSMRFRTARSNRSLGVGRRVRVLSYGSVTALSRRYFDEIQVAEENESPGRPVTEPATVIFAGLSADYNVLHTAAEFMNQSIFGERIATGL